MHTARDECKNACCILVVHAQESLDGPVGLVLERIVALDTQIFRAGSV